MLSEGQRKRMDPTEAEARVFELFMSGVTSPTEIAQKVGWTGDNARITATRYLNRLVEKGKLAKTETGRTEIPRLVQIKRNYIEMDRDAFVASSACVKKWVDDLSHRGKGGGALKGMWRSVAYFKSVCEFLKLDPEGFVVSTDENVRLLKQLRDKFAIEKPELRNNGWRAYVLSVRSFTMHKCPNHERVGWVRGGADEIASGRKHNYGDYSKIYASDEQIERITSYAAAHFDKEMALMIAFGHEVLCPRDATLRSLKAGQVHVRMREGYSIIEMEVHESKGESDWSKIAFKPSVVKGISELAQSRSPSEYLFGGEREITQERLADSLQECYSAIGIDVTSDDGKDAQHINYWKAKSIHMMRHSTAHMWMRRSGLKSDLVANMGWKSIDIVRQVYANMGMEMGWSADRCDYCKPSAQNVGDRHFCGWRCALKFLNENQGVKV